MSLLIISTAFISIVCLMYLHILYEICIRMPAIGRIKATISITAVTALFYAGGVGATTLYDKLSYFTLSTT